MPPFRKPEAVGPEIAKWAKVEQKGRVIIILYTMETKVNKTEIPPWKDHPVKPKYLTP